MRTLTYNHPGPTRLRLDIGPATVEVRAEDRADTVVTLAPATPGDPVAADLIERATGYDLGSAISVTVPRPARPVTNGTTVIQSGRSVTVCSNVVIGSVVMSGGDVVIGGRTITGPRVTVAGGQTGGVLRAVVRVPVGSSLAVDTDTADVTTFGPLTRVDFHSVSGDLMVGSAEVVSAVTVSGDVSVGPVFQATVKTTSGDVDLDTTEGATVVTVSGDVAVTGLCGWADVDTVSGDIGVVAVATSTVVAHSVSGDVRASGPVSARLNSVSGRVRQPRGGAR